MNRKYYNDDQLAWLKQYMPEHYMTETIEAYKEKYGIDVSYQVLFDLYRRQGIQFKRLERELLSKEAAEFVRDNSIGKHYTEMVDLLREKGLADIKVNQLKAYYKNHGILTGYTGRYEKGHITHNKGKRCEIRGRMSETMFKSGHRPHNWMPVGTEVVKDDGYLWRKIGEPRKWKQVHRIMWEETHGEALKPGDVVLFLDGDRMNMSPDNLERITQGEMASINKKYPGHLIDADLSRAIIAAVRLQKAARKRAKR